MTADANVAVAKKIEGFVPRVRCMHHTGQAEEAVSGSIMAFVSLEYINVTLDMDKLEEQLVPESSPSRDDDQGIVTYNRIPAAETFRQVRVSVFYDHEYERFRLQLSVPYEARDEADGFVDVLLRERVMMEMPALTTCTPYYV